MFSASIKTCFEREPAQGAIVIAQHEMGLAGLGDLSPNSQTSGAMRIAYWNPTLCLKRVDAKILERKY